MRNESHKNVCGKNTHREGGDDRKESWEEKTGETLTANENLSWDSGLQLVETEGRKRSYAKTLKRPPDAGGWRGR